MNRAEFFRTAADKQGIPLATVAEVQASLERAKVTKADAAMARLMLRHGRLTEEARDYIAREYPQAA